MSYASGTLYSRAKNGKLRTWRTWTQDDLVYFQYGPHEGAQTTNWYKALPTNVGRSNERDGPAQAEFEAKAATEHKLKRKYTDNPNDAIEEQLTHLPMLAKVYDKKQKDGTYKLTPQGKKFEFPAAIQPKFDGFRCLARWENGEVRLTSRQGQDFILPHVSNELRSLLEDSKMVLDGELYVHGVKLQTIASWVKKLQDESQQIKYMVYDCIPFPGCDAGFKQRWAQVAEFCFDGAVVEHCPTYVVNGIDEARQWQSTFLSQGFEGAMLRGLSGVYHYAYRSPDLLKLKTFTDAEFEIVDVKEGKGGMGSLVCRTAEGKEFAVTFGDHETRKAQVADSDAWIGKPLTVRYAFLTDEGKPFHPTGVSVREEWD